MAAAIHLHMRQIMEREDKWDVDDRFVLPDLERVVAGAIVAHDTVDLTSTYYDTTDRDLQACGILVRRRDGDDDTGWHVKIPAEGGRTELHWPLSDRAPAELTDLLTGITAGRPLSELATIHTVRERYRITEPVRRHMLAEVADDHVRASVGDRLLAWREVEVELGTAELPPRRLTKRLIAAGARPSRYASKLAHAVPPRDAPAGPARGSALTEYLDTQIDQIIAGDLGLRRHHDPIHDTRVAIRRLRSTLRVFSQLLDHGDVGDMDGELKWFAGLLGEVRDCQVQQRRFLAALDDMPDELVLGPVRARIRTDLQSIELPARTRVAEAMSSERYLTVMAKLRRWRAAAPLSPDVTDGAFEERARKAARKADKRLASGVESGDGAELHRARKAAKRARYAAELLRPVSGKEASRTAKHYKRIQSVLGDHQDTVVARTALRRMGTTAGTAAGENGFTFGLMFAREQRLARQSRRDARALL
jgi:CHAD domain-containing protein